MIDSLYFLQFACFIFMLINALILGITHLHMKWDNRRYEWSRYFTSCLNSPFRIWLAEVRFEAAKKMMLDYPDYSNDIISAECGFSSRSYLYRIFKEKEGCSPTVWRAKIQ